MIETVFCEALKNVRGKIEFAVIERRSLLQHFKGFGFVDGTAYKEKGRRRTNENKLCEKCLQVIKNAMYVLVSSRFCRKVMTHGS